MRISLKVSKYIYSLSLGHLFVDFSQGALAALLPTLIAQHHYNYAVAAILVFAMNLVSSVVQPLFGFLSDKYNTGWIIILAILITGIGFSSLGYVPTYALLVIGCLICGIGIAAYHPDAAKLVNGLAGYNPGQGMSIFSFGGNIGFAIGPITLTLIVNHLGIHGIGIFLIVTIIITLILLKLYPIMHRQSVAFWSGSEKNHNAKIALHGHNDWLHFSLLSMVLFGRSIIFYGLNTFLVLYWMHILKQSNTNGSIAFSVLFVIGSLGTLLGGRLADNIGSIKVIRLTFCILPFLILALSLTKNVLIGSLLLLPIGLLIFLPYSAIVILGQRYLPNNMGFASGVTLGLAISIGGIATPFLGYIGDATSLVTVFQILAGIGLIPLVFSFLIREPK